jgi:hypothetical protein
LGQRFFRAVSRNPPDERDFYSYALLGKVVDESKRELAEGVSVRGSEEQARVHLFRRAGAQFLAVLDIPDDSSIRWAKTLSRRNPDHYTLWGDPADILACVVRVIRVDDEK